MNLVIGIFMGVFVGWLWYVGVTHAAVGFSVGWLTYLLFELSEEIRHYHDRRA